jgi:hypothetical protein
MDGFLADQKGAVGSHHTVQFVARHKPDPWEVTAATSAPQYLPVARQPGAISRPPGDND